MTKAPDFRNPDGSPFSAEGALSDAEVKELATRGARVDPPPPSIPGGGDRQTSAECAPEAPPPDDAPPSERRPEPRLTQAGLF